MMFTKELALKGAGALTAASAASAGLYYALDDEYSKLSKFDKALIGFLKERGKKHDIVFEIKKGGTDFKESDLTFSGSSGDTLKFTVKATVKVPAAKDTANQTFFVGDGGAAADDKSLEKVKKFNKNGWTWECNIEFSKTGASQTGIKDDYKNAIFKETNKGLFGILKTKISEQNDAKGKDNKWKEYKNAKINFIQMCGESRDERQKEEYNGKKGNEANLTITASPAAIKFVDEGDNLVPENKDLFNSWFKTESEESK